MNAELLREAAEWRLIGLLFESPTGDWSTQVEQLAAEISDDDLMSAAAAARPEATAGLYHSTFGPGGPAAPREVSYRPTVLPGVLLSELGAHYRAFAYAPATDEPPDHVAVMAGFIGYLRLKEAYAQARGNTEQAAVCAAAAQRIIAEHLSWLAGPLAESLSASGIRYLALAAAALLRRTGTRQSVAPAALESFDCAQSCAGPEA